MVANSKIEWCDHTLNWWYGCEAISPACAHCYAEAWAKRGGIDFSKRKLTREETRNMAFRYQGDQKWRDEHGRRPRVFVNSLSDWADNKAPQAWRDSLFRTIKVTPDVTYLLLTKRIGNAEKMLPADWGDGYENVWLGSTVIDQEEAQRDVPKLLRTPARVHFLSIEPMLGPVRLRSLDRNDRVRLDALTGQHHAENIPQDPDQARRAGLHDVAYFKEQLARVDWVIAGGESGGAARPISPRWLRGLRDDCAAAGVSFFFKQWGEFCPPDQVVPGTKLTSTHTYIDGCYVMRFGKKACGALLDGQEHKAFPEAA